MTGLHDRASRRRQTANDVMVDLNLKKFTAPDFTVSLRPGKLSLLVIDEDAVPKTYWEPGEPRLRRQILANDLKQGEVVAGGRIVGSSAVSCSEDKVMGFSNKQLSALQSNPDQRKRGWPASHC